MPFGLQLAPKIFNAVADGLEWVLAHEGVRASSIIWTTPICREATDTRVCHGTALGRGGLPVPGDSPGSGDDRRSNVVSSYFSGNLPGYGGYGALSAG